MSTGVVCVFFHREYRVTVTNRSVPAAELSTWNQAEIIRFALRTPVARIYLSLSLSNVIYLKVTVFTDPYRVEVPVCNRRKFKMRRRLVFFIIYFSSGVINLSLIYHEYPQVIPCYFIFVEL